MRWSRVCALLVVVTTSGSVHAEVPCAPAAACVKQCEGGATASCDHLRSIAAAACERDVAVACTALAELYTEGLLSTPVELDVGARLNRKGCELGHGHACNEWAFALAYGHGVKRDDPRAVTVWKRGCELDDGLSCVTYGGRLKNGRSIARDDKLAGESFAKACTLGHAEGCLHLGLWHDEHGRVDEARTAWRAACAAGEGAGCRKLEALGEAPPAGGTDPAVEHARHKRMCDKKVPAGCSMLAADHRLGRGVKVNAGLAEALEMQTCVRDKYAPSCAQIGAQAFDAGDFVEADRYYAKACDLGASDACGEAATVRRTLGKGNDARTPLELFQLGCDANDPASCFGVGGLYETGTDVVRPHIPRALTAYTRACDGRHAVGCAAAAQLTRGAKATRLRAQACKLGHRVSCSPAAAPAGAR